jgi:hypothetical protein
MPAHEGLMHGGMLEPYLSFRYGVGTPQRLRSGYTICADFSDLRIGHS